jgi:type IV pilus assembly protein PilQ
MNQVTSSAAANFLTSQGAETQIATTKVSFQSVGEGAAARTVETRTPEILALKASEGSTGTLLLRGLSVTTDERLNAITLVGSPRKVEMATSMLTRLDARRRQVALNVKIVDVNLTNADTLTNSLSFKAGDGFLAVDGGAAAYNYGGVSPVKTSTIVDGTSGTGTAPIYNTAIPTFNTSLTATVTSPQTGLPVPPGGQLTDGSVISTFTGQRVAPGGLLNIVSQQIGAAAPSKFLSTLQAQIINGNGKILTDPTLVVQEGQKSTVKLTQQIFGGFKINTVAGTGATTSVREPIINESGLTLDILVNRIDDNGFVSVGVSPTVSAVGNTVNTADGTINLLNSRTMNSGEIRLRDGQTLILSGIIQESDRSSVTKVPILGDIPILGALFRSTVKSNQRQEVVVLLTPQILDDNKTQVKYAPGVDARMMIGK